MPIGQEMVNCQEEHCPIPDIVEVCPTDDNFTRTINEIIKSMTHVDGKRRKSMIDVEKELAG